MGKGKAGVFSKKPSAGTLPKEEWAQEGANVMNPLTGCCKGYRECVKKYYQREKCEACPYLGVCCEKYCIFPRAESKAIDEETKELCPGIFEECVDFILKDKPLKSKAALELMDAMGLMRLIERSREDGTDEFLPEER